MKYDELLRDLMENEAQFLRQLNLILKVQVPFTYTRTLLSPQVFKPPFYDVSARHIFLKEDIDTIFGPVQDIYDTAVQLKASIEEMIEVASEMEGGTRYPQTGFCFEEATEVLMIILLYSMSQLHVI